MRAVFAILLCCAVQAAIFAQELSDEAYLNALTQAEFITKAEEEELAGRRIPGHIASRFLKALNLRLGKSPAPKDVTKLSDEEYAERLLYPRYITRQEYEKILRNGWSMIDSTIVLEDRELPSSVLFKLFNTIGYKELVLTSVKFDPKDILLLLSSPNVITLTEEEEARKAKTRLGQRLVLPDVQIDAYLLSLFLKKVKAHEEILMGGMKDVKKLSDEDYFTLLAQPSFVTQAEYDVMSHYGAEIPDDATVLKNRKLDASNLSKMLKKLKLGATPFDTKQLSNMGYLALLATPGYKTKQAGKHVKVLPDRYLPASFVSWYLKRLEVPLTTQNRLTDGSDLSDYDYAALLSKPHYVTQSEFDEMMEKGYDVIDSTRVLQDRPLSSKALSKILKTIMAKREAMRPLK
ncbi:hypothetical protein D918_03106 [Trichuris suis]|nr:hypothetical protein D918_03106 [Trichuris suis]